MNSREKMDKLKDNISKSGLYEDFTDAIYECIGNAADYISDEYGYDYDWVYIALQEMIGVVEKYTAEEIDNEIADARSELNE